MEATKEEKNEDARKGARMHEGRKYYQNNFNTVMMIIILIEIIIIIITIIIIIIIIIMIIITEAIKITKLMIKTKTIIIITIVVVIIMVTYNCLRKIFICCIFQNRRKIDTVERGGVPKSDFS